jgi:histidinol-phosphate/aromatic aminotransferase/cobyric acid decarboxylase-like protein/GNAT superfamily N-acetyltransferase
MSMQGIVLSVLHALTTGFVIWHRPRLVGQVTWDLGHALMPYLPLAGLLAESVAIFTPILAVASTSKRVRHRVVRTALRMWLRLWACRIPCTVVTFFPPLSAPSGPFLRQLFLGTSYDTIFSGHTAFMASWLLAVRPYISTNIVVGVGILHAILLLAARYHYTVDILLAWMLALLIVVRDHRASHLTVQFLHQTDIRHLKDLRHDVYVRELGQERHAADERAPLVIGAVSPDGDIAGFVALTPPHTPKKAVFFRGEHWDDTYELRALTVAKEWRSRGIGKLLLMAAARCIQSAGGTHLVAMARLELLPFYRTLGFEDLGPRLHVGNVTYAPGTCPVAHLQPFALAADFARRIRWRLPVTPAPLPMCSHGNGSTETPQPQKCIAADVLDAWYDPSPKVMQVLTGSALKGWHVRTTPEMDAHTLRTTIAAVRGVPVASLFVGAGSSDLMYHAFPTWLTSESTVLVFTPTYAEYLHLLRHVIRCTVHEHSCLNLDAADILDAILQRPYDLVVLVNPNSPLGVHVPGLARVLPHIPAATKVWIDETYVDYVEGASLEPYAHRTHNVVVCKSMSKVYALSGLRVAYICANPMLLDGLWAKNHPWRISRLASLAACAALEDPEYYRHKLELTRCLRESLVENLADAGFRVFPGACANFVVVYLPTGVDARWAIDTLKERHRIYIREAPLPGALRLAVRTSWENTTMVDKLRDVCATK